MSSFSCRKIILRVILSSALVQAGSAFALTLLPPLPPACTLADKAQDAKQKVDLYSRCLSVGGDGSLQTHGIKMHEWQRRETHFKRGNALFELGRYQEALADYDLFIGKSGAHVWAYHQRGMTHEAMGHESEALADYNEALKRNMQAIDVRYSRGQLLAKQGQYRAALADLRFASKASPETAAFLNELAWLLATCPEADILNGEEAVQLAQRAAAIERNAMYLDTLAAAYARTGQFHQAVAVQQEAIDLLHKDKVPAQAVVNYEQRLKLYQSRQPYTETRVK